MAKLKVVEFSAWLKEQVGMPYLWGGNGETLFDLVRTLAIKNGQAAEKTTQMLNFMKSKGCKDVSFYDCSGLGVKYLMDNKIISSDMTAAVLYKKCTPITESEVTEGCWGFLKNTSGKIYHIGYVVDNGNIVHALNQSVGVILEPRSRRKWIYAKPDFAFAFEAQQNAQICDLKVGSELVLAQSIKGYNNANNALKGKNATVTYPSGTYYVYKIYNGAVNISKKKGSAGAWVVL